MRNSLIIYHVEVLVWHPSGHAMAVLNLKCETQTCWTLQWIVAWAFSKIPCIRSVKARMWPRQFSIWRVLLSQRSGIESNAVWSWTHRSVPFRSIGRSSPLMYSPLPRCHGLWWSQKYKRMFVVTCPGFFRPIESWDDGFLIRSGFSDHPQS